MRKYNIPSDFIHSKALQPIVYKQYDNGDTLEVELYEDGEKIALTDETVLAFFQLEDSTVIQKTCTISNGNAIATLDNNILSQSGKLIVEFTIFKDGSETTTRAILISVESSINRGEAIETIPQWDIVQQVLDLKASDGTAIEEKINVLNEAVEDKFNELSAAAQVDSEVIFARGGEANLNARLDKFSSGLADIATNVGHFPKQIPEIDDTARIQRAINAATTKKGMCLLPPGEHIISGELEISCDINFSQGKLGIKNGGKITIATNYVTIYGLNVVLKEALNYEIINFKISHVNAYNIRVDWENWTDTPVHTAINIEPIESSGLWDVNLYNTFLNHVGTGIRLKSTGWITGVNIRRTTIVAFKDYGIKFDDTTKKGIAYCTIDDLSLENIHVSSLTKTGIYLESFGNLINDVKDFNDDALMGTYTTIKAVDTDINSYIASGGSPTLANHCMQFMGNKLSNIRAEGIIDLGPLKNLYKLENIHVYQKIGITEYNGYEYHHDFSQDYLTYDVDLSTVPVNTSGTVANTSIQKGVRNLKVTMNATDWFQIAQTLPTYMIEAANKSKFIVVVVSSDIFTDPNTEADYLNIRHSDNTLISGILPSINMRKDKKLAAIYYSLEGITLQEGDFISLVVNGEVGRTYKTNCIRVYTELVNPIQEFGPFLKAL